MLHAYAIAETTDCAQPVVAALLHPIAVQQARRIDAVAHAKRITEAGGHDADNRVVHSVERDRAAQNIFVAIEVLLPKLETEDRYLIAAVDLFAGQKGAAQQRLHAKNLEEVIRGVHAIDQRGSGRRRLQCHLAEVAVTSQRGEDVRLFALILEAGPRGGLKIAALAVRVDADDAVGIDEGQRAKDDGVDDAEDCSGHAHAESKRKDDGDGKAGGSAQLARRVAQILE